MKNLPKLLAIILASALISCSAEETTKEPEETQPPTSTEVDTYNYIALQHNGQLVEIGNYTGKVTMIKKLPEMELNIIYNAVTASKEKYFIYTHRFDPFQGYISIYDKATKTTERKPLDLPENSFGTDPGLVYLEWDEENSNLVALVKENFESGNPNSSRVARIDPVSMEVTSLEIEIQRTHILSAVLKGNKIYASTFGNSIGNGSNSFFEIDLEDGSISDYSFENLYLPPFHFSAGTSATTLFGFIAVAGTGSMGASEPVLINLAERKLTPLLPDEITGSIHNLGRSFYNSESGEYVDFITSTNYNGLFQYDVNTGEVQITHVAMDNFFTTLVAILDVRKL